jgi:hypothetical protein
MFTADQSGSHFFCALDSAKFGPSVSPANYSGIVDGQHAFFVCAVRDKLRGPTASWTWTIDTVPPAPGKRRARRCLLREAEAFLDARSGHGPRCVLRSVGADKTAKQVYAGSGDAYVEKKFTNSVDHRTASSASTRRGTSRRRPG